MRAAFVQTSNWQRFQSALSNLERRGAEECRLIVVDGLPGLGKTTILSRWANEEQCVYLRAKTEWTPYWLLSEILTELGKTRPHGREKTFNAVLQALGDASYKASLDNRQFALVVDEADHISRSSKLVDTVRDLADLSGVPVVLVGMGRIRENLARFPQTTSRVSQYVRFEPGSIEDVELFLSEQCDVPVARCLAEYVHKTTRGFNREIREAIVRIESHGRRNPPLDPERGLTAAEMDGKLLIFDRKTGAEIKVKASAA